MANRTPISRHRISGCAARIDFDTPDYLEEDPEDNRLRLLQRSTTARSQPDRKNVSGTRPEQPSPTHILSVRNNVRARPAVPEPSV